MSIGEEFADIEINQIEADPNRDLRGILRIMANDIYALRADGVTTDDAAPLPVLDVVVVGAKSRHFQVTSARADMAHVVPIDAEGAEQPQQLTYVDGVLWRTQGDRSEQVIATPDGVNHAMLMATVLRAAGSRDNSGF